MTNKILERFNELCLPFGEGKEIGDKKDNLILKMFPKASYIENVGIYLPSKKNPKKIIVSHMDLVRTFQNGFLENKKFKVENGEVIGALDNTLTNAILTIAIENSKTDDVAFLFTEGEETGLTGMSFFMGTIYPMLEKPFFINLDVTNEFYNDFPISVEFDRPNFEMCKQIFKGVGPAGFTHQRFTDDTSAILGNGGNGMSFCIPTNFYCHTYESRTKVAYLEPYLKGVQFMIDEFDASNYVQDMQTLVTKQIVMAFKDNF